ncbi:MAG: hypothetical protein JSW64_02270 [Candidatus Zixiibacteriota bacterium]|nr:MAG: hypothetical protein JSW64_02270 [candidate division Zixibacteria bacterium]
MASDTKYGNTIFYGVLVLFSLINMSFVWFYRHPLSADMPMHAAVSKALLDLLFNANPSDYPYILNLALSTYELPQLILAGFMGLFGVVSGTKLALSLYAVLFPFSVYFLVSAINPESKWTRLIGFPLTFNYFYHWGFWPLLLGITMALFSMAVSIKYARSRFFLLLVMLTRLFTFLMHPTPLIALFIFDCITILMNTGNNRMWYNPLAWNWKSMLSGWSLTIGFIVLSIILEGSPSTNTLIQWSSFKKQLIQLIRPLYVTDRWWESILLIALGLVITVNALIYAYKNKSRVGLFVFSFATCIFGVILPRGEIFGSWEHGSRVVFIGIIALFSLWSVAEEKLRKLIILWVIITYSTSIIVSFRFWNVHARPFENALSVLKTNFHDQAIKTEFVDTNDPPSVLLGCHIALWAWNLNYIKDAYNEVGTHNFGPVKYIGLPLTSIYYDENGSNILINHPYGQIQERGLSGRKIYSDNIYTIVKKE